MHKEIPQIFVPFTENGIKLLDYNTSKNIKNDDYPFGFTILFDIKNNYNYIIELNEGIRLSEKTTGDSIFKTGDSIFKRDRNCCFIYNFPSSYIQLDVAREKINNFKIDNEKKFLENTQFKKRLGQAIIKQVPDLMKDLVNNGQTKLFTFDVIYRFCNRIDSSISSELLKYVYFLEFDKESQKISVVKQNDADLGNKNKFYIYSQGIVENNGFFSKKMEKIGWKTRRNIKNLNNRIEDYFEEFNYRFGDFNGEFNHHFEDFFGELNHRFEDFFGELNHRFEKDFQKFDFLERIVICTKINPNDSEHLLERFSKKSSFSKKLSEKDENSIKKVYEAFFKGLNITNEKKYYLVSLIISYQRKIGSKETKIDAFTFLFQLYVVIIRLMSIEEIEANTHL